MIIVWYQVEKYIPPVARSRSTKLLHCLNSPAEEEKMSLPSYASCSQLYCGICTKVLAALENPQQRLSRNLGCCGRLVCGGCIQVCILNGDLLASFHVVRSKNCRRTHVSASTVLSASRSPDPTKMGVMRPWGFVHSRHPTPPHPNLILLHRTDSLRPHPHRHLQMASCITSGGMILYSHCLCFTNFLLTSSEITTIFPQIIFCTLDGLSISRVHLTTARLCPTLLRGKSRSETLKN